jgi:uncharacterized membrane protein YkoI
LQRVSDQHDRKPLKVAVMQKLLAAAAFSLALAAPAPAHAQANKQRDCLTTDQQRVAIASGQAVPLAKAIRAVRGRGAARPRGAGREVVKARLCREPKGLVYRLTVLARDGTVTQATVDAATGSVVTR